MVATMRSVESASNGKNNASALFRARFREPFRGWELTSRR
ncbi:hypothetical protein AKJ09_09408 [Labilithrix luteola]|uniref:Uncharacterized protein n=1 Tax=Labilithrix luteola TaxID=1391654 RepID=A0A0K1QBG6_9BACT|nr:hypothetical protein AKJ09_09408 [Labilithrix luteola]